MDRFPIIYGLVYNNTRNMSDVHVTKNGSHRVLTSWYTPGWSDRSVAAAAKQPVMTIGGLLGVAGSARTPAVDDVSRAATC